MTAILVCRKWSKFEEAGKGKRNSQDDTPPRSKINTETESLLYSFASIDLQHNTCNVHCLVHSNAAC